MNPKLVTIAALAALSLTSIAPTAAAYDPFEGSKVELPSLRGSGGSCDNGAIGIVECAVETAEGTGDHVWCAIIFALYGDTVHCYGLPPLFAVRLDAVSAANS